jgi:hypothetical protein
VGTDIFRVEKKNYSSPGYAETAASTPNGQPLPQVRFEFKGDSRRKETCVFLESQHATEIAKFQSQVDQEMRGRCERETVKRRSAEDWLEEEGNFLERERKASEGVISQIHENVYLRRECWRQEKKFFDDLLILMDKRNAIESELNKMIGLNKRNEKKNMTGSSMRTLENLAQLQQNEQALKQRVEGLQAQLATVQTKSKSEMQRLRDETEKLKIKTRQSVIKRKQKIDGMANDVKLLAQRILRVREGLKKYEITNLTQFQNLHPMLAALERIAQEVETLN